MKSSPLSQSQAGVYYACLSSVNDETNYQNAMLITLPSGVDIARFQNAVYEALCDEFRAAGFFFPRYKPYTGGIACGYFTGR